MLSLSYRSIKILRIITPASFLLIIMYALYSWQQNQNDKKYLNLNGNVDIRQVELGFRVPGRILEMRFEEGDAVKKGAILAVLEKDIFESELKLNKAQLAELDANFAKLKKGNRPQEIAQAHANLKDHQATHENAKIFAQRQKELVASGSISKQEYEDAATQAKAEEAKLNSAKQALSLLKEGFRVEDIKAGEEAAKSAKAAMETAQINLADTEILAPNDGVIFTRVQEVGAVVASGMPVYTLSLNNSVWVRAYIDEPDLGRVKPGMEAYVTTDTASNPILSGKVGFISPQAEFTPKTIETKELRSDLVYRIRIIVDDPNGILRQGMPVMVKIVTTSDK